MQTVERIRIALAAVAAALALTANAAATAAYAPKLVVTQGSYVPGAQTSLVFDVSQRHGEDETARTVLVAPPGYVLNLPAIGARIGAARGTVDLGGPASLTLPGEVTLADQAVLGVQAAACTGSATHAAAFLLRFASTVGSIEIPAWVDAWDGITSSYRIEICLPSSKSLPLEARVLGVAVELSRGIVTSPGAGGQHVWTAFSTPYLADGATANTAGTVESRGGVFLPASLTLRRAGRTLVRVRDTIRLAGALVQGAVSGARVTISTGPRATRLDSAKQKAAVGPGGRFGFSFKATRAGTVLFRASYGPTDITATGCASPSPNAPGGCTSATLSGLTSAIVRVTVKK